MAESIFLLVGLAAADIIETLIRLHPDWVTFRPWEHSGPIGECTPKNVN